MEMLVLMLVGLVIMLIWGLKHGSVFKYFRGEYYLSKTEWSILIFAIFSFSYSWWVYSNDPRNQYEQSQRERTAPNLVDPDIPF